MTNPYGARLYDHHAQLLADSAITPEVAAARGYATEDTAARLHRMGFSKKLKAPGLLIPVHNASGDIALHEYRPDVPRVNEQGRPRKYEKPWKSTNVIDVPPPIRHQIGNPDIPLWITEGARKADAAVSAGLCCVSLAGVDCWRNKDTALPDWELIALRDREVLVCFDNDVMTKETVRRALTRLTSFLSYRGARVKHVILPGSDGKVGLDDYLAAGGTVAELETLAKPCDEQPSAEQSTLPDPPPAPPAARSLAETVGTFRGWLYLEDPHPLYALAAALVANRAPGDPVWLLLVCAPSTGKTEMLSAAARLPWVVSVAKVTESALLSGTSKRERAKDATGGVLRQIGEFGVMLVKDFTSVLAQNKDARAEALAALREVYDGRWDRPVGADGGRMLTWQGKAGMVGGVTPALDRYAQVTAALGDRFVLLRMPDADVAAFGTAALDHGDRERQMRTELADALGGLVEHADTSKVNRPWTGPERDRLIRLAAYTARARTAVDRDGYRREILYLPQVEGPGRLVKMYARLFGGLEAIGCDQDTAWSVLARVAIDSVPSLRTDMIRELIRRDEPAATPELAAAVDVVSDTARLHLEDLSLLKIAQYSRAGDHANAPYLWSATDWLRQHWPEVTTKSTPHPPHPSEGGGKGDHPAPPAPGETGPLPATPYFSSLPPADTSDTAPRCQRCDQRLLLAIPGRDLCERCRIETSAERTP